ncbi:MAG: hypothetical protein PSX81_05025 [bacterium]|nr:hypothetical protein [bacterium]
MLKLFKTSNYNSIILFWILFSSVYLNAQQRDTLDFYRKLKIKTDRHKFTKLLYESIIVEPVHRSYENKRLSTKQNQVDPNAIYEGKIIRKLIVIVYDPFGHSVNDTFTRKINGLQKAGNRIHITTRHKIIRNILLFEANDTIEMIRIKESERLLRQMNYINDARITISGFKKSDSADVTVKVMDKWSLIASGDAGINGGNIRVRDRNLSGLGQTYDQRIGIYSNRGFEYTGDYNIANIKNSFISSDIYYTYTAFGDKAGIAFKRPFYSPLTRWAGGMETNTVRSRYNYTDTIEPKEKWVPLNFYNYDGWLAKSFPLELKKKKEKTDNIIVGIRYANVIFVKKPSFELDTNKLYVNTKTLLGSVGYSRRKYYKDQFIYRFGANEDVPEGVLLQGTYGLLKKDIKGLYHYLGFEFSKGKHLQKLGYLSSIFTIGTLLNVGQKGNTTINTSINYFTDLRQKGKWYFRTFTYLKMIKGFNKEIYETLTLKPDEMYGFNPNGLSGNGKILLNIENVAYAPYNIIGFKFAPVMLIGMGMIETLNPKKSMSKLYQAYSLGLLIRNENLLNSSFEFSFGFYPEIPGNGSNVFKFNPIGSFSLKIRNFDISKPNMIGFD